ncbi:MAG: DMT family transporter [Dehalococcoidia bacterium]|uniref:EamA domain-containing protein n=1 Tax=marine metagenome TaxID=408172 RepID=A0A381RJ32_9ZZZZ|nr:DMT family transporter [Dehalococcoidia bacterium]MEC9290192.1 DMT family transporter [Chloroflexota bacterium]
MAAVAFSILAAFGFASSAVLSRQGLQAVFPLPGVMVSLIFSFLFTGIMALLFAFSDIGSIPQAALLWILGLGIVNYFGGRTQNFLSVNLIGASRASLFVASQAPFAALFAVAFTGESLHLLVGLGTVGVVGGLIFASGTSILEGWRGDKIFVLGYLMALGAGASYGATNVMAKQTLEVFDSPLVITMLSMLVGMLVLAPLVGASTAQSGVHREKGQGFSKNLWSLRWVALAGIASGIAVISLYFAVQRADVVVISPIVSSSPLITLFLAHVFLTRLERVTKRLLFGALLTVGGVVLVVIGNQL